MDEDPAPDRIAQLRTAMLSASANAPPKYEILRSRLLHMIDEGVWQPGEKLPTETQLTEQLPVSLGTVQKAYKLLADDGIIGRQRGHGSFVRQRNEMPGPLHCLFRGRDGEVLPIFPVVRSLFRFDAASELAGIFAGERDILRIDREISVNNEFQLWNRFYIPFERARLLLDLSKEELNYVNFKTILGVEPRSIIRTVEQKLWAGVPKLHSPVGSDIVSLTAFTIEARAIGRDGAVIYLLEILVPKTDRPLISTVLV